MKLSKLQLAALVDEIVERLSDVDVTKILSPNLKKDYEALKKINEESRIKSEEVTSAQAIADGLDDELRKLNDKFRIAKRALESKYDVVVDWQYDEDYNNDTRTMRVSTNLGGNIQEKLTRQITIMSIDENIDDLTSDQLIEKIVSKNMIR